MTRFALIALLLGACIAPSASRTASPRASTPPAQVATSGAARAVSVPDCDPRAPIAGRLSDRSVHLAFGVSTAIFCLSIVLLALPPDLVPLVVLGGSAFVNGLTATIAVEYVVARRTSSHDRPRILAALHTWQDFGSAGGALGGGVLAANGAASAQPVGAAAIAATLPLCGIGMRTTVRVPVTA